jgi:hypothetical protein
LDELVQYHYDPLYAASHVLRDRLRPLGFAIYVRELAPSSLITKAHAGDDLSSTTRADDANDPKTEAQHGYYHLWDWQVDSLR